MFSNDFATSPYARKVWIVLRELALPFELLRLPPYRLTDFHEAMMPCRQARLSVMDLSLIAALDTVDFREVFPWRGRPNLEALPAAFQERPSVRSKQPTRQHPDTGGTPAGREAFGWYLLGKKSEIQNVGKHLPPRPRSFTYAFYSKQY